MNLSPLFFASYLQGKKLKSIVNFYLRHMNIVLQLITDDRYNQKPWRGLLEGHYHDHWYQDITAIFQSYVHVFFK